MPDYGLPRHTCPSIDSALRTLGELASLVPEEESVSAKDYSDYIRDILEELREANATLRERAIEAIEKLNSGDRP